MTTNSAVLAWIDEIKALVKAEKEIWIDGSREQSEELKQLAVDSGLIKPLNQKKLPGCVLHRTSVTDAARSEKRTFICYNNKEDAGPTNNWCEPSKMYSELKTVFDGIMSNRTMYIIPFCLGNPDSPLCRAGVMITDSIYVVLNTLLLTRCGKTAVDYLDNCGDNWFKGLHSIGTTRTLRPQSEDNRYICHFPEDNAVWAANTGYGVSAFLSKKSIALRLISRKAYEEGWFAEHMAVIEIERPGKKEPFYIAAAFPAGAGKTSLAMMEVSPVYAEKGYKVRCVSEDVAWLKKGADGRLWAVNPETGIFGALPGVSAASNPNVIAAAQKDAIYTNTAHRLDDNTVWWEGMTDEEIVNAVNWRGNPWDNLRPEVPENEEDGENLSEQTGDSENSETEINDNDYSDDINQDDFEKEDDEDDEEEIAEEITDEIDDDEIITDSPLLAATHPLKRGAHSGSRFTASIHGCPNLSEKWDSPEGVPISAIVFGGRRTKSVPLVYQSFDWVHGVFVGTILGTESVNPIKPSAAVVRREPMAMMQFCGYNMGDYWTHWLKLGKKLGRNAPKIFNVNWFKNGLNNKPLWPGFGENIRVLDWIIRRTENNPDRPGIIETAVGYVPKAEDIDISGIEAPDFSAETLKNLLSVDKALWKEDVNGVKQLYSKFGDKLPEVLKDQLVDLEKRLMNS